MVFESTSDQLSAVMGGQMAQPRQVDHHRNDREYIHIVNCRKNLSLSRHAKAKSKDAREQGPIQVTIQPSPNSPGDSYSNHQKDYEHAGKDGSAIHEEVDNCIMRVAHMQQGSRVPTLTRHYTEATSAK